MRKGMAGYPAGMGGRVEPGHDKVGAWLGELGGRLTAGRDKVGWWLAGVGGRLGAGHDKERKLSWPGLTRPPRSRQKVEWLTPTFT